jgi:fibronectin-binding autotransporter adhesin
MRPASSRVFLWMSVLSLLAALFAVESLAFGQSTSPSRRKLSREAPPQQSAAALSPTPKGVRPLVTTETWTGGGGSGNTNWSDASNWNNGAITSGEDILINLTTAATNEDDNASIGTLTLSNAGDSVTLANGTSLTVSGNISNNGTITINSAGSGTVLDIGAALMLSGNGSVVLGTGGPNYISGPGGTVLTNASTISGGNTGGSDNVGDGALVLANTGTINANVSGATLVVQPGGASTNMGTLEATGGGVLNLNGSSWTQTGAGTISAQAGSTVVLYDSVSITGGTLTTSGTGVIEEAAGGYNVYLSNLTNAGTYDILNGSQTIISGTITNNGTINLDSAGSGTALNLSGNTTLAGTGVVVLGSGGPNYIDGTGGAILTNNSTIEGVGNVGDGALTLVNNATINADVSGGTLILQPAAASTNTSTLEATNGGVLNLDGSSWTQTGAGTIEAQAGSAVVLYASVSITGGTLTTSGTGVIEEAAGGYNVYLNSLTNAGTYDILNGSQTIISGTITNNGTINLQSGGSGTDLYVTSTGTQSATLTGSGTVVLGTGGPNYISGGGSSTLTNDLTIEGVGNIGEGALTLVNNATINANVSPTVSTAGLYIEPGAGGLTNNATLEATNGGTLLFDGGTITNTGGTIQAVGSDSSNNPSTVVLYSNVTITGGTLTTSGAGVIEEAAGGYDVYLSNLTNAGTYDILNGSATVISGTITNNGTINIDSTGSGTSLYLGASTTLKGTGPVILGNSGPNYIYGAGGSVLTNDLTIEGAGNVGDGAITLVNDSVINANVNGGTLILQPGAASTNTKTLEASNGGVLNFDGSSWTQTGTGTIEALTGSTVVLYDSVTITGGTLTTTGTGVIEEAAGGYNVYLSNLTNAGTYDILNGSQTIISGTITNNGTINLDSGGSGTTLSLGANATLKGKGSVVLGNGGPNYISGVGGTTLTNDETIEGAGNIGDGAIKVVNDATIDANVSGAALVLQPGAASTNSKTLEASNGGVLSFDGGTWTNKGTIEALTGSTVVLYNSVTITGGTLTTAGTGVIEEAAGGYNVYLSNLTNAGTYDILNGSQTIISGTITNNGTINLDSGGSATQLYLSGNTTLAGTGAVVLGSGGPNYVDGAGGAILTNDSTIEGTGNIGDGALTITNNGTLDANVAGDNLSILPGSGGFTNYNGTTNTLTGGTYIANGGNITFAGSATGITTLSANVVEENGGQIIDTNGSINALANLTSITSTGSLTTDLNFTDPGSFSNAGSLTILKGTSFTVQSLSQISGSTLTAGTYVLDANLNLSGTTENITTNAANLTLGGGTIENANSTNALAGLATNSGSLTLANDATFTTAGNFSNTGTLTVDKGSSFTVNGTLAQISGSTLASGTFVLGGNLNVGSGINITTNATSLTLEGGTIESGASNALANLASNTGSLTLANSASFTTGATSFANSGALTINSGSTFTVTNTLSNLNGGTLSGGTYTIGGTLQLASANGDIVTNAANLTLTGKTPKILDGTANALAGFDNNTGSFTLAGDAVLTTAASNFSNSGTVDISTGSTLTVGGTGNAYNQTAGKTTVDGTLTGAVNLTGGTIQGAGTLKGNVSVGGTGTTPTLNVGDSGLAGLLKITGTYTQLSTGTLNVAIGGLTSGTQYSKLTISGAASLSGTLTVNMINGFVPAVGKTFTILSAKSITGTFSTQYIVINSSEYFAVTYTATGVVLKVDSGTPPAGTDTSHSAAVVAVVKEKEKKKTTLSSDLRKRYNGERLRQVAASGRDFRDTLAQRYPLDNNLAYRFNNQLGSNVRPPNDVYGLAIWRGPSERPVALPKAPAVGVHGPSLHPANDWTLSNRGARPLVNTWQNNQGRTMPTLRTMPSLMRAR